MYKIIIQPNAEKKLAKLPQHWKSKIGRAISLLVTDPFVGKKLHGNHRGAYSLRAWPYRIIYTIDNHRIIVHVLSQ